MGLSWRGLQKEGAKHLKIDSNREVLPKPCWALNPAPVGIDEPL